MRRVKKEAGILQVERIEARPAYGRVTGVLLGAAERWRWGLWGLVAVIYLAGFTGIYRPEPDSALYLTIGRNLAEGRGFTYHGETNRLAYPGFPLLLAGVFKAGGVSAMLLAHVAMLAMAAATLVLVYAFLRLHESRAVAVFVTFNVALANVVCLHAFQIRNDMPFLLGVMGFLTGYEGIARRGRGDEKQAGVWGLRNPVMPWVLAVGGLAVAVAMRPAMLALVAAIIVGTVWGMVVRRGGGKLRKRHFVAAIAVIAVVGAFYVLDPRHGGEEGTAGQYEETTAGVLKQPGQLVLRIFRPATLEGFSRCAAEAMFGHEFGIGANTVVMLPLLGAIIIALYWRRAIWGFYLLATVVMLLLMAQMEQPPMTAPSGTGSGQLVPRHFLGVLPLMIYGGWLVAFWLERVLPERWGKVAIIVVAATAFVPNFAKECETVLRQREYASLDHQGKSETAAFERVGKALRERIGEKVIILAPRKRARVLTFYSHCNVVEATPTLDLAKLSPPLYAVDQASAQGVMEFVDRGSVWEPGPVMVELPGGMDWRGKRMGKWVVYGLKRK